MSLYRLLRLTLSPLLRALGIPPHSCRFIPTCSQYCEQIIKDKGSLVGGYKCLVRIISCNPLSKSSLG